MIRKANAVLCALVGAASAAQAFSPILPADAVATAETLDPEDTYGVAVGPAGFAGVAPEEELFGIRTRSSWRIEAVAPNSAALMQDLRTQVEDSGAEILFACSGAACGGFDFRAGRPVLPMPDMFVDLQRFQFLSARLNSDRDNGETGLLEIMTSESPEFLHLQISRVDPATTLAPGDRRLAVGDDTPDTRPVARPTPGVAGQENVEDEISAPTGPVATRLRRDGHVALDGLEFNSGTAALTREDVPVLAALAAYLKADPNRRIALVGHSDWTGDPGANRRLSEARAAAVSRVLIERYAVARRQIEVFGAGDLTPRTTNTTEQGRSRNRRVDAVARPPFGG